MNMHKWVGRRRAKIGWAVSMVFLGAAPLFLTGCATQGTQIADNPAVEQVASDVESKYGIHIQGLHLSAHGYILDLRYRVFDAKKAAPLLDAKKKVFLLDEAHNAKLGVPQSPVIGGMRQTSRNYVVYTDRDYFILFVNPGRAVRAGQALQLGLDDIKIGEVTVQ